MATHSILLKSEIIFPVSSEAILKGAVWIEDSTIRWIGKESDLPSIDHENFSEIVDLKNTALLPGFVNAHAHLELTALRGFGYSGNFVGWVKDLIERKTELEDEQIRQGIQEGAQEMIQSGITTVADHASHTAPLEAILKTPLRGRIFIEVLGTNYSMAISTFDEAKLQRLLFENPKGRLTLTPSPHSVHALHPRVLGECLKSDDPVFSIHLGESFEEELFFRDHSGAFHQFISERAGSVSTTPEQKNASAFSVLETEQLLCSRILAVHANHLTESDLELLERHQIAVVHCPDSHAYFGHRRFPLETLLAKKITIALGTDSVASGKSLSMLEQMRIAQKNYPHLSAEEWIGMATLGGAKALKMENQIGTLEVGKKADVAGFSLEKWSGKKEELGAAILEEPRASFVMIDGKSVTIR